MGAILQPDGMPCLRIRAGALTRVRPLRMTAHSAEGRGQVAGDPHRFRRGAVGSRCPRFCTGAALDVQRVLLVCGRLVRGTSRTTPLQHRFVELLAGPRRWHKTRRGLDLGAVVWDLAPVLAGRLIRFDSTRGGSGGTRPSSCSSATTNLGWLCRWPRSARLGRLADRVLPALAEASRVCSFASGSPLRATPRRSTTPVDLVVVDQACSCPSPCRSRLGQDGLLGARTDPRQRDRGCVVRPPRGCL